MIHTRGLARTFGKGDKAVEAVRGIDMSVGAGEIVGFLGPNGAGKTTTLRMLTTLLKPTAGEATVVGHSLANDANGVRKAIGYVPQGHSTEAVLTCMEELVDQAEMYRMSRAEGRARAAELIALHDLAGLEDRKVSTLSGGQRRRLEIALGLVHTPQLIFLDEPTTGLDPQSRANMWDHVRRLRADFGATVFLTTHYLEEADALCDRIMIIDQGRIVKEGTPDALKRSIGGDVLTLEVEGDAEAARVAVTSAITVREAQISGHTLRVTVEEGNRVIADVIRALDTAGIALASISLARPSLDDVFLTLTGRSLRDDNVGKDSDAASS
ncbi:MAG: ATP-binding cassette domain-containing protein [Thermoleophilia bacterium]|nr:ATP-binding cassette domain-containing protein [Thermoleophilia bacterium]